MTDSPPTPNLDALLEHGGWVRALAFSLTADASTAEDVEQKTWLAAIERPPSKATNPRAWLGAVVRNVAGMHWREQKARRRREKVVGENRWAKEAIRAVDAQPNSLADRLDTFRKLAVALAELPDPYGGTLYLRFFEELTVREIAERMHVPESTAQARITRGLSRLRGELATTIGKDWRNRCLVFTVPLTQAAKLGGLTTVLAMTLKTKILVSAAALAIVSLLAFEPWVDELNVTTTPESHIDADNAKQEIAKSHEETVPSIERSPLEPSGNVHSSGANTLAPELALAIQVLDGETLEPVPHAEILYLDLEAAKEKEWSNKPETKYLDHERRLEFFGELLKTNQFGFLEVAAPKGRADIAARIGNQFGYQKYYPEYSEEGQVLEVLLHEIRHQRVIVRDETGLPTEGVEVGFAIPNPYSGDSTKAWGITDEQGVAELRHLQIFRPYSRNGKNVIGLRLPCEPPQSVALDEDEIGQQDIQFVLPATGEVQVICQTEDGSPAEGELYVELQSEAEMKWFSGSLANGNQVAPVVNGVATFPNVGVGTKLVAGVFYRPNSRYITSNGTGPQHEGDQAQIHLIFPNQTSPITLRLLDSDNHALPDLGMSATLSYRNLKGDFDRAFPTPATDAQGLAEISADSARQVGAKHLRILIHKDSGDQTPGNLSFAFVDVDLVAQERFQDPIDAILGKATIVAGLVTTPDGIPVADEEVELTFEYIGGPTERRGFMSRTLKLATDKNGSFRFAGPTNPGLYAYHLTYGLKTGIPFQTGQKDLILTKSGSDKLWGRVIVDDPDWLLDLEVHAFLTTSSNSESIRIAEKKLEHANGRFRFEDLPSKGIELQLRQFNGFGTFATLDLDSLEMELTPDGKRVPNWDLCGKLHRHVINLEVEGEANPLYFMKMISELGTAYPRWDPGMPIVLYSPLPSVEIEIHAHPYRIQKFTSNGEADVLLSKGIPIRFNLPAGIAVPEGSTWLVGLTKPGRKEEHPDLTSAGWLSDKSNSSSKIKLQDAGTWTVSLTLLVGTSVGPEQPKPQFQNGTTTFTVEVADSNTEQLFTIPLPAEALEEAMLSK